MDRQQMPFLFRFLSDSELYAFKDGQIISTFIRGTERSV